ncbi:hypothetical protein BKA59DRAFT_456660 [Fusarium tricinctum]|uniref:Uncharacterized protein n=2 Tax=Fusarium tricinctum species complex TaxID=679429 RepID=A0A8K0WAF8_9HYPO|nr:hypothetical protein BKA59DRAFT_456660 [Fusarium tricinctum]
MTFSLRSILFAAAMALSPVSAMTIKPSPNKLLPKSLDPAKNLGKRQSGAKISIIDGAANAPCGLGICCSPICQISFSLDDGNCPDGGSNQYALTCKENFDHEKAGEKRALDHCDGWSVFWEDGAVDGGRFVNVEQDGTGNFYSFFISGCDSTNPTFDPFQCAASGGGCSGSLAGIGAD